MTPLDLTSPKDLIHLFIDGEINDVQRTVLFRELADSSELQEYLSAAMRTEQMMEQYRAAATVPDALRTAIFAQAGFGANIPAATPAIAAAFWRYGTAISLGAAILTGGISFRSALQNTPQTPTIARVIEPPSPPATVFAETTNRPDVRSILSAAPENTNPPAGKISRKEEQYFANPTLTPINKQAENSIAAPSAPIETTNSLAMPDYASSISLSGSARPESPVSRIGRAPATDKDASVLLGGFGGGATPAEPTRLALMYVFNHEVSAGLQYSTRTYNLTAANGSSVEVNPTVTGLEGVFQYTENSDILPLNMKPVFSGAVGYNRLGPTAFLFTGVSYSPVELLSVQTGAEANVVFYDSRGSRSVAGGVRFTLTAGLHF